MCGDFNFKYKNKKTSTSLGVLEPKSQATHHGMQCFWECSLCQRSGALPPSRVSDGEGGGGGVSNIGELDVGHSTPASPVASSGSRRAVWKARPAPQAPPGSSRTRPRRRWSVCTGWCQR